MTQWFRFYAEALDDPKVQTLPPELFRAWVNILCLAARNDGQLPSSEACAFALRETVNAFHETLRALQEAGLIDAVRGHVEPHNWRKRQYRSDTSTERVKRFRKRSKGVSETPPETEYRDREEEPSSSREEDAPNIIQFPPPEPCQSAPSDEERYWSFAAELQKKGVARSMVGKLANLLDGSFDEGCGILLDVAAAKKPTAYLGAIIRERARASPDNDDGDDDGLYFDTTLGWIDAAGKAVERRASRSF